VRIALEEDLWGAEEERADALEATLIGQEELGEAKVDDNRVVGGLSASQWIRECLYHYILKLDVSVSNTL
jgi:hypothetical protein